MTEGKIFIIDKEFRVRYSDENITMGKIHIHSKCIEVSENFKQLPELSQKLILYILYSLGENNGKANRRKYFTADKFALKQLLSEGYKKKDIIERFSSLFKDKLSDTIIERVKQSVDFLQNL